MLYICARDRTIRTGRPAIRAAAAAMIWCGQTIPLQPNAPPVCGERTRTCSGAMPNSAHITIRTP